MLLNSLRQLNWLDIFILIIILRICYIASKTGLPSEFFKFIGTLLASCVSMHYYVAISDSVRALVPVIKDIPAEVLDFVIFLTLAIGTYLVFVVLRNITNNLLKIEAVSTLNKWGGLLLGSLRSLFLVSFIVFVMAVSPVNYLKLSVKHSYFGPRVFSVSTGTYNWLCENLFSKLSGKDSRNKAVLEIEKEFTKR